jgi:hypothetical protein
MSTAPVWLNEKTMIPDLLTKAPGTRAVLDRYGLRGCGGPLGPVESVAYFAKAHEVPLPQLMNELGAAATPPAPRACGCCSTHRAPLANADAIYRPFFLAGIGIILTLGAAWGAYLLLNIGLAGSFRAVGLHEVNAHGHAQIFGWVGLYVMGFAYQAFPRFKHTTLLYPGLAWLTWGAMLAGVVGRSVAEPFAAGVHGLTLVVLVASLVEVWAIATFGGIITATLLKSGKPLAVYDGYVFSALCWFLLQAAYDAVYAVATLQAAGDELRALVATWQGPLREMQIHGFTLLMILGVSQRIFPNFYGFPAGKARTSLCALVAINLAVVGEVLGLLLMTSGARAWAGLWYGSVLLLAAAVVVLVREWRIFGRAEDTDRSLKFLRGAYVWLLISLAMLVALPLHQFVLLPGLAPDSAAAQMGFSHAYYGAIRHAITVGFISLMIMGVAAKVVPTLNGLNVRTLSALWLPFLLLNAGCALRVGGQTLTDFVPQSFPVTGISGIMEVTALAIWGVHLIAIMAGRIRQDEVRTHEPERLLSTTPIAAEHLVNDVLEAHPDALATFVDLGFKPLTNPLARRTLARRVSIANACRFAGVDLENTLATLNARHVRQALQRRSLPVLDVTPGRRTLASAGETENGAVASYVI